MSTRLYFSSIDSPDIDPAFGSWDDTSEAERRAILTEKNAGEGIGNIRVGGAGQVLVAQCVSGGLAAQTISGTVKVYLKCLDRDGTGAVVSRLLLKVVSSDGSTVRGTLLDLGGYGPGTAFPSGFLLVNRVFADGDSLTSVDVESGDCLVVEIGANNPGGGSEDIRIALGAPSSLDDLPENETEDGDFVAWIEFSADIEFLPGPQTLSPGFITSGAQVFGPTLDPGAVEIEPGFIASGAQIFDIELAASYDLEPGFIPSSAQVFDVELSPTYDLEIDFIASEAEAFDVTLDPGFVELHPDFIASEAEAFDVELSPGAVELEPGFIPSVAQAFDINLRYDQSVEPDFIPSGAQTFDLTLDPGAVDLTPGFIASGAQTFDVELSPTYDLEPGFIPSGAQVFGPTLDPGPVELAPGFIAGSAQVFDFHLRYEQPLALGFIASAAQAFTVELDQGAPELNIAAIPNHTLGSVTILIFNADTSVTNELWRYVDSEGEDSKIKLRNAVAEDGTFIDNQAPLGVKVSYFIIQQPGGAKSPVKSTTVIPQPKLYFHQTTKTDNETNAVGDVLLLGNLIPQEDARVRDVGEDSLAAFESPELTGSHVNKRILRTVIVIKEAERVAILNALWTIFKNKRTVCARDYYGRVIFGTIRSYAPEFRDNFVYFSLEIHQTSFTEAVA